MRLLNRCSDLRKRVGTVISVWETKCVYGIICSNDM